MTDTLFDSRRHKPGCSVFAATGGPPCDCGGVEQTANESLLDVAVPDGFEIDQVQIIQPHPAYELGGVPPEGVPVVRPSSSEDV